MFSSLHNRQARGFSDDRKREYQRRWIFRSQSKTRISKAAPIGVRVVGPHGYLATNDATGYKASFGYTKQTYFHTPR